MKKLFLTMILFISGCASYNPPSHVTQQGNLLPEVKVAKLRLGMHKQKVAQILGDSLLMPLFAKNRWDYAYSYQRGNSTMAIKSLQIFFRNNAIVKIKSF